MYSRREELYILDIPIAFLCHLGSLFFFLNLVLEMSAAQIKRLFTFGNDATLQDER